MVRHPSASSLFFSWHPKLLWTQPRKMHLSEHQDPMQKTPAVSFSDREKTAHLCLPRVLEDGTRDGADLMRKCNAESTVLQASEMYNVESG
jgi:hypothetical protein